MEFAAADAGVSFLYVLEHALDNISLVAGYMLFSFSTPHWGHCRVQTVRHGPQKKTEFNRSQDDHGFS